MQLVNFLCVESGSGESPNSMVHVEDALAYPLFLKLLNYCLILEDGIEFIWQWMFTQDSVFDTITSSPRIAFLWRAVMVRSMVGAQEWYLKVHDNEGRCADSIIKITLRTLEAKHTTNIGNFNISLRPATLETHRILTRDARWDRTNGMLWDKFVDCVRHLKEDSDTVKATMLAELDLVHPTKPDPEPILQMVRSRKGSWQTLLRDNPSSIEFTSSTHSRSSVSRLLSRIMNVLRIQGRTAEAAEIAGYMRTLSELDNNVSGGK